MSRVNIIQAWKSAEYRASPTEAERAQLPDHPAGLNELMNTRLEHVDGSLILGPEPWSSMMAEIAGRILHGIGRDGWRCGTPSGVECPSLMTRLAGTGYELQRLAGPTCVPAVLTLESVSHRCNRTPDIVMEVRSIVRAATATFAVGLGTAALAGCHSAHASSRPTAAAVSDRELEAPARPPSASVSDVDFVGVIVPRRSLDLAAKFDGRIEAVAVRLGDRVKQGSVIATQDSRSLEQDIAMAEASLRAAQAEHDRLAIELAESTSHVNRLRGISDLVPAEQLASAVSQEKVAAARLQTSVAEAAERHARVDQLRETLSDAQIRAPFDGTIAARYVEPGTTIGRGTPVARLIDSTDLGVRFAIPEELVPAARGGVVVRVGVAPTLVLNATIENVAPEVDASLRMVVVEGRLSNIASPPINVPSGTVVRITFAAQDPDSDWRQQ
jgi:RND family efflux transporter MFP subunit/mersacidin/lichenicidin family type 2 lantibiotic